MIDTSPDSIRLFVVMILGIVWFYLLNDHLRSKQNVETCVELMAKRNELLQLNKALQEFQNDKEVDDIDEEMGSNA